jgi:polysaccharide export outer membrane protein
MTPCKVAERPYARSGPGKVEARRCWRSCYKKEIVNRLLLLWSLLPAVIGCASNQSFDYSHEPDPRRQEFILGPADVLRINVWHMPDLSVEAKVRPDGTVTMPLVGDLPAAGRTASALRGDIESRLKSYIKDDSIQVSVAVSEVNSYQFTVAGYVEHPGLLSARRFVTVTEAVALAGGPSKFASLSHVVLIRPTASGPRRIPIDLAAIYSGEHPEMNIVVIAGDTIHLP